MQTYHLKLESEIFDTYRCQKAANSLDIDVKKKSIHEINIQADLNGNYNICLIVGASGSGKTTLAKHIFGANIFQERLKPELPVIDQFPQEWSYDDCAAALAGIGLTSVPCWIRPAYTLSNGQRARAEAALQMAWSETIVIDEWTSVVDRTVAKVMSHCVQKYARKSGRKAILLSCHYDVIEWLDPDLIIDCNNQSFTDRRLLPPEERRRSERLQFDIREVDRSTWRGFAKYHYLSERLPGGQIYTFGLFAGENQIGFQCFANYVPRRGGQISLHSNRTVIHPDYAGLGLGIKLIDETSAIMFRRGFAIYAKFSSTPIYRSMIKSPYWVFLGSDRRIGSKKSIINHAYRESMRKNITTYSFRFIPRNA